jgi:hypothetical protein
MKLIFSDHSTFDLGIKEHALGQMYKKIYKNLCRVNLIFCDWDNPFYLTQVSYAELVNKLVFYGKQISITVERNRCLDQEQQYFNELHKIYELNYNGQRNWLDFHEHIHLCESYHNWRPEILDIDYREKSGMLEKPFDLKWLEDSTTVVKAGDVFVSWSELGKTPYGYWDNNEPDNIDRLCELAKPWLILRPKIKIALEDIDFLKNKKITEFESWWSKYESDWCQHWNLKSWSTQEIFSKTVFGQIQEVDAVRDLLKNNINPTEITMS